MPNVQRTNPPYNYLQPVSKEVSTVAKRIGVKKYKTDIMTDLANLAAGGNLLEPDDYAQLTEENAAKTIKQNRDGSYPLEVSGGSTRNKLEGVLEKTAADMQYNQNVGKFLETLNLNEMPGDTSLEKSFSVIKMLQEMNKDDGGNGDGDGDGDGDDEGKMSTFKRGKSSKDAADKLNDLMDLAKSLTENEREMMDGAHGYKTDGKLDRLRVAMDFLSGDKAQILKIARECELLTNFKIVREVKPQANPEGNDIRQRPLRDFSEIGKIPQEAWGEYLVNRPLFNKQLFNEELTIRERIIKTDRKQCIMIICDASGSMSGRNHLKATGIIMNRLQAVHKGDAEVWLAMYDDKLYNKISHAFDKTSALKVMEEFRKENFGGGGTDTAGSVRQAIKYMRGEMKKNPKLFKPELVVLTDEDSSAGDLSLNDLGEFKLHGFGINSRNRALVQLARASGGVGVERF